MRQAYTPACLISFLGESLYRRRHLMQTSKDLSRMARLVFPVLALLVSLPAIAQPQPPKSSTAAGSTGAAMTPEQAMTIAQQGRCAEAIPGLKHALTGQSSADVKKNAGILGIRCSLTVDNRDTAVEFIRLLSKQFPKDPDVMFIVVHAYSDLSSRTAQDLARTAPQSIAAHKLNAEAFEMQGNWSEAEHEYEMMIAKEPNAPALHFLLGRLLLSKPNADQNSTDRAKQEFQKELEIDPKNVGAYYVLGELARREDKCDVAAKYFADAAKQDPTFAEAYLGWGSCLVKLQKYAEAIPPLKAAEKLTPGNQAVHYNLAVALNQTGQKEEAQKEFAIHRELTATTPAPPGAERPQ
jgi:Tfp pilus assembly protein PilF